MREENSLELFIKAYLHDSEAEVMNILQDRNAPVSDECVRARDVANAGQVIAWMNHHAKLFTWRKRP